MNNQTFFFRLRAQTVTLFALFVLLFFSMTKKSLRKRRRPSLNYPKRSPRCTPSAATIIRTTKMDFGTAFLSRTPDADSTVVQSYGCRTLHCKFGSWAPQLPFLMWVHAAAMHSCWLQEPGPAWIIVFLHSRSDVNLRLVHRGMLWGLHFPTGPIIYAWL
jgi:hypothetical protein